MLCGVIYSLIVIDTLVIIANDKDCGLGILKQADKEIGRQIEAQYYCQLWLPPILLWATSGSMSHP